MECLYEHVASLAAMETEQMESKTRKPETTSSQEDWLTWAAMWEPGLGLQLVRETKDHWDALYVLFFFMHAGLQQSGVMLRSAYQIWVPSEM
jgi:hypothetical protein